MVRGAVRKLDKDIKKKFNNVPYSMIPDHQFLSVMQAIIDFLAIQTFPKDADIPGGLNRMMGLIS